MLKVRKINPNEFLNIEHCEKEFKISLPKTF